MSQLNFKKMSLFVLAFLLLFPQISWSADSGRFSVTPRIWMTNMKTNFFQEELSTTGAESSTEWHVPLQGATITYAPNKSPDWDFLATALYGTSTANFVDGIKFGNTELSRLDMEFLARKDIKGSTMKAIAGVRYIRYDADDTYTDGSTHSSTGSALKESSVHLYIGEFGVSGFNNITANGKHRMFWNALGGLGYADADNNNRLESAGKNGKESIIWTWDINIGYVYTINKNFGANARYRSFGTPSDLAETDQHETLIIHGPELGLTYHF